jgi:hypothetical protein
MTRGASIFQMMKIHAILAASAFALILTFHTVTNAAAVQE